MSMKQYEYKIEEIHFTDESSRDAEILKVGNRLGKEGWQISSLAVAPRPAINETRLKILFERRIKHRH